MNNDDQFLISKTLAGDKAALQMLYEQNERHWFRLCLRYGRNRSEAQDIMQEGLVMGGVIWNKVVFEDYFLKVYVQSKANELPVDKVKILTKGVPAVQYLGAYAGLGLNSQLLQSWHLITAMTHSYDINDKSNKFLNSKEITYAFSFGLNYRF